MKIKILFLTLVMFLATVGHSFAQPATYQTKTWSARVKVIGEDGQPVSGASISIFYTLPPKIFPDDSGKYNGKISGLTDTNGLFLATHNDRTGALGIQVQKTGYYTSHIGYEIYFDDKRLNPSFILVLKKIGNPIPMYAKKQEMAFPELDKPIGFDLEAGDWVTPYGKGFHTDISFRAHREIKNRREFNADLTIIFPNQGDGIVVAPDESAAGSEFKTSRTATENGYQPELDLHYSNTNQPPGVFGYFIRVRTELNQDGTVKSALYGKIPGNFRFFAGTIKPTSGMGFTYYLNPTPNDRNLEFNPKRNLVTDMRAGEEVKEP